MSNNNDSPIIWYVPGFRSGDDHQIDVRQILRKIYPNAEDFELIKWEFQNVTLSSFIVENIDIGFSFWIPFGNVGTTTISNMVTYRWRKALADVKPASERLVNKIRYLPLNKRQKLILIGHSLGANLVIRTLAHLYRRNLSIHSAVLLGAAIDNRSEDILWAMKSTQSPIYSMINPQDYALATFRLVTGSRALGTGCDLAYDHTKFREYQIPGSIDHSSSFYLTQWGHRKKILFDLK